MILGRLRAIANEVLAEVERRCYAEEEVRRKFCCRTADEILADGHIHYATPCHDLATVVGARLRAEGVFPVPVLCRIKRLFRPVKFQCGLELVVEGEPYYIGFSVTTNRLARGRFVPVRSRTHVLRAAPRAAPPGAPHLAFFGVGSPAEVARRIEGHDLERHLRTYRASTSRRAFERARRRAFERVRSGEAWLLEPGRWAPSGAARAPDEAPAGRGTPWARTAPA